MPSSGVKKLDIRGKVSGIKNAFYLFCYLYSYLLFLTSTLIPTHELPLLFLWYPKGDCKLLFLKPASWGEEKWFCLLSSLWTEKFNVLHICHPLWLIVVGHLPVDRELSLDLAFVFLISKKPCSSSLQWMSMNSGMAWPFDRVFWSYLECENGSWVWRILFGLTCWESSHWIFVVGIEFSVMLTPVDASELKQISLLLILIFVLCSWSWLKFLLRLTSSPANL